MNHVLHKELCVYGKKFACEGDCIRGSFRIRTALPFSFSPVVDRLGGCFLSPPKIHTGLRFQPTSATQGPDTVDHLQFLLNISPPTVNPPQQMGGKHVNEGHALGSHVVLFQKSLPVPHAHFCLRPFSLGTTAHRLRVLFCSPSFSFSCGSPSFPSLLSLLLVWGRRTSPLPFFTATPTVFTCLLSFLCEFGLIGFSGHRDFSVCSNVARFLLGFHSFPLDLYRTVEESNGLGMGDVCECTVLAKKVLARFRRNAVSLVNVGLHLFERIGYLERTFRLPMGAADGGVVGLKRIHFCTGDVVCRCRGGNGCPRSGFPTNRSQCCIFSCLEIGNRANKMRTIFFFSL
mmetsp:Transcript_25539/g.64022  ORF Transcript_25539/g.64022 Transcript_25539/m.64022 type:complete len:345 (+) Transcript_25539:506-1540(+)